MNLPTDPNFDLFLPGTTRLLPASFWPQQDELFSSWIVRLAHAHSMKAHTFTAFNFKEDSFWNRDVDRSIRMELIEQVKDRTNASFDRIYQTTLRSYQGILFEIDSGRTKGKWLLPLGVFHRTWKRKGLMFCPGCLTNDHVNPYFRKHWRLSFSIVCLTCKCWLMDACPKCHSPITFFRAELGQKFNDNIDSLANCYSCRFDLSKSTRLKADPQILKVQAQLFRIMAFGWKKEVIYPFQFFEVLYFLVKIFTSKRLIYVEAQKHVAQKLKLDLLTDHRKVGDLFDSLPLFDRANALRMAYWLVEKWPIRFIKTFKTLNFHSSDLTRDFKNIPYWYFSIVYQNFHVSNVNRRF